jgi:carbamoyl-phosphate synthase large subunit
MPKRADIKRVLIIGSGPIVIGQACEFDYAGTQAVKTLKEEGIEVILLNSNPATIMTDPDLAHRTYIEPITLDVATRTIERERPDALLATMGGQTALNLAQQLAKAGVLDTYGVKLIGASLESIHKAEDREAFKAAMDRIGLATAKSVYVQSLADLKDTTFPAIVRPSFTLGGQGGGIARNASELKELVSLALRASSNHSCLVEESLLGWKEFELEVVRDSKDNAIIVCTIENFDPMGVHTGDSITVAPAQTLTDKEQQNLRNMAIAVVREIGVDTGGANVQFAVEPETGRVIVIEMNPRVSRSSALASKATGYPIAKVATRLALGYTLDELKNDITRHTPASFEPSLDYVVVKIPRFAFEQFPNSSRELGTQMRSVGEVMALGGTFEEAFHKALASMEQAAPKLGDLRAALATATPERAWAVLAALRDEWSISDIATVSRIDPWFIAKLAQPKRSGKRVYKRVDTCAAEFEAFTPYFYSTIGEEDECEPSQRDKIMILGSGPNRIGQGVEFDYCCVHASMALREAGFETIMVNCNPETVSTDPDVSDRLYVEPLTLEHVVAIAEKEKPLGVLVQLGGQTPLKLAQKLKEAGVPILGTQPEDIDRAEDREAFARIVTKLGLRQPAHGLARSIGEAVNIAAELGYPVLMRPSYVLGGRAMRTVRDEAGLRQYMTEAVSVSHDRPVLIDRFLDDATEVDVDLVRDHSGAVRIGGVLEHVEQAGVHSGDAACILPPHTLSANVVTRLKAQAAALAEELSVIGLMNVQFAVKGDEIFIIEANPRASRTVPFVAKATGVALAKIAALCMAGRTLAEIAVPEAKVATHYAVKEAVFPFQRFAGADVILGPEMK